MVNNCKGTITEEGFLFRILKIPFYAHDIVLGIDANQTRKPANPQRWIPLSRLPVYMSWLDRPLHTSGREVDSFLGIDANQTRKPANPQTRQWLRG
jgi:hypothetical protein